MQFKIVVITPEKQTHYNIKNEVASHLNGKRAFLHDELEHRIRNWIIGSVQQSDTWQELRHGELNLEMGLGPEQIGQLDKILKAWEESLVVDVQNVKILNTGVRLEVHIHAIDASYGDVLSIGTYMSINKKGERHKVDWLTWLLLMGGQAVITGYYPKHRTTEFSRTGKMLMLESLYDKYPYFVPVKHQGIQSDNFVTKIFARKENEFRALVNDVLKGVFP